jgi:hypothetical protein
LYKSFYRSSSPLVLIALLRNLTLRSQNTLSNV